MIAASVPYFTTDTPPDQPRSMLKPSPGTSTDRSLFPAFVVGATTCLIVLCGAAVWEWGSEQLWQDYFWWIVFGVFSIFTLAGFHIVYTHVWLIATACLMQTDCTLAHAACTVLGFNISCAWYASLWWRREVIPSWHPEKLAGEHSWPCT